MSIENDPIGYDEEEAVKFIKNSLPSELKDKFTDDEINYIIDIVYDFYEEKGLMDPDSTDDAMIEIDEDEMIGFVLKNTKKDKIKDFTEEEISFIVKGELEYCDSLNMFE